MPAPRVNLYLDRATVLYRMHPQVKLGLLFGTFVSAFVMDEAAMVLPVSLAIASLLWLAGAGSNVRRLWLLFVAVPTVTFVIWCFFYGEGEPLPVVGRLGITREAVRYAAGMALKLETFLGASILFLSITRVEEFTAALRGLGLPVRVSFAIALSFRLVPLFLASALSVVDAQRARGLDFSRGTFGERLRRYVPIIVPVFMAALRRADSMAMALEVRGFAAERPRTVYV
ncbi:MAG: energy-coupling factor transporter transmembrane component T, partial [Candidatus Binatia bacterium]